MLKIKKINLKIYKIYLSEKIFGQEIDNQRNLNKNKFSFILLT